MENTIEKTIVKIIGTECDININGDKSPEFIKNKFKDTYAWLVNATVAINIEDGVKYITFTENTGGKSK